MIEEKIYRPRLSAAENKLILQSRGVDFDVSKNGTKKYLVLGCVHVPFNNKALTKGVLDLMSDEMFDGIVLAGDFLDMNPLGTYEKGRVSRTGVTLEEEYEKGLELLKDIDSLLLKGAKKVFMFGNHEERYYRWKADINNFKYGDQLNPIKNLKLKQLGYEVYSDYKNDVFELNSLNILHGEYFNVHCAKKHLDVFRRNVLFFHTHRVQTFREGDFAAYNAGFLGDINSEAFNYAPRGMKSAWGNGFAVVTTYGDRHFVDVVNCVDNKFAYKGKIYGI